MTFLNNGTRFSFSLTKYNTFFSAILSGIIVNYQWIRNANCIICEEWTKSLPVLFSTVKVFIVSSFDRLIIFESWTRFLPFNLLLKVEVSSESGCFPSKKNSTTFLKFYDH